MLSLIISIIALGLIVTFHEFGHFIVARAFKVGVVEFSLGMGPRIASLVKGGTRYSLAVHASCSERKWTNRRRRTPAAAV